jgi:hypothetical protein
MKPNIQDNACPRCRGTYFHLWQHCSETFSKVCSACGYQLMLTMRLESLSAPVGGTAERKDIFNWGVACFIVDGEEQCIPVVLSGKQLELTAHPDGHSPRLVHISYWDAGDGRIKVIPRHRIQYTDAVQAVTIFKEPVN